MDKDKRTEGKSGKGPLHIIAKAIAIVLCVVFGLTLLFNLTIIVKGLINPNEPPSVFGVTPLIVKSGSMSNDTVYVFDRSRLEGAMTDEQIDALNPGDTIRIKLIYKDEDFEYTPEYVIDADNPKAVQRQDGKVTSVVARNPAKDHIETGDLIITKKVDPKELKLGDVISFKMKSGNVNTHRIVKILEENGKLSFRTRGDFTGDVDDEIIPEDAVISVYRSRIPSLGDLIFFLQQPVGMVIFIGVPVIAFIVFDIIRRSKKNKQADNKTEELEKELERLRALAAEKEQRAETPLPSEDQQN